MQTNINNGKDNAPGQNKEYNIIVNGKDFSFSGKEISYTQVVELAYPDIPKNERNTFTVSYQKGENSKPNGNMSYGDVIRVKEGIRFNVVPSNRA